jgi:breast cancer 2 susceptibility protein
LSHITPDLAIYYSFHTRSSSPTVDLDSDQAPEILGSAAALAELHGRGCMLATKEWVDNHWSLILWKLAGMVMLDPDREVVEGHHKRWCWEEVIRQLLYRFVWSPVRKFSLIDDLVYGSGTSANYTTHSARPYA